MTEDLDAVVDQLRVEWGLDYGRIRSLLALLASGRPWSVTGLVEETGLPRRNVEATLRSLEPWLPDGAAQLAKAIEADVKVPADPAALIARMTELAAGLPPSLWRLDHVPATPETMVARALYLATTYELAGASVLCLGDHDLTSLAVGALSPTLSPPVDVAVVDIDDLLLDHIRTQARAAGTPVTTAAADLRLGLPATLAGTADLVFTDPPYTAEGIRLFLTRAVEALRPGDHARIAFCYGTGERHLSRAVEIQTIISDLRLAIEAVLPGFNRYRGAEAIGSRSNLYVCRPTPKTWTRRRPPPVDPRIYTRGPGAVESGPVESGPAPLPAATVDVPTFAARTVAWATGTKPTPAPFGPDVTLDLGSHFGASLTRLLLMSGIDRATFIVPGPALASSGWLDTADPDGVDPDSVDPVWRLLTSAYDVVVERPATGRAPAVVTAARHGRPPADCSEFVLAHLVTHPGAKAVNAWREALVAWGRTHGAGLTKNDARARIDAHRLDPALRRLRPYELPRSALADLVTEVARSTAGMTGGGRC